MLFAGYAFKHANQAPVRKKEVMRFWAFSLPLLDGPERILDFQTEVFSAVVCS